MTESSPLGSQGAVLIRYVVSLLLAEFVIRRRSRDLLFFVLVSLAFLTTTKQWQIRNSNRYDVRPQKSHFDYISESDRVHSFYDLNECIEEMPFKMFVHDVIMIVCFRFHVCSGTLVTCSVCARWTHVAHYTCARWPTPDTGRGLTTVQYSTSALNRG